MIYSKQTFVDRIPAKKGDALFVLLSNYSKNHPKTLKLKQHNFGAGLMITSINELDNEDLLGLTWKVYRGRNGLKDEEVFDLSREIVEEGFTYIFEYS